MLFFDVGDRLGDRGFVRELLLGVGGKRLLPEETDVMLRRVGHLEGAAALDVLAAFHAGELVLPQRLEGMTRRQLDELHLLLRVRLRALKWSEPLYERLMLGLAQQEVAELGRWLDGAFDLPDAILRRCPFDWARCRRRLAECRADDPSYHGRTPASRVDRRRTRYWERVMREIANRPAGPREDLDDDEDAPGRLRRSGTTGACRGSAGALPSAMPLRGVPPR